jgi:tetratricopeptide (TPR) repeat protein
MTWAEEKDSATTYLCFVDPCFSSDGVVISGNICSIIIPKCGSAVLDFGDENGQETLKAIPANRPDPVEDHPEPGLLERFMRNEVNGPERRRVVRHLLAGCAVCGEVTRRLWELGEAPPGGRLPEELEPAADLQADAAACHRRVVQLLEAGRWAESLRELHRARRLYKRLGDGPGLARLRHLEGKIGQALGAPAEAEAAFRDARRDLLLEGLGGEAAEALLDLAVLYARQGRSGAIRELAGALSPILRAPNLRQGVGVALLFFRGLAESEQASLEALSEILRYVRPVEASR